ncbi:MAG: UPF0280 family protein [Deltaproteobacteria bacterium]|nr:UPF0280 family protein [Deltaproteobacteria bacterium]
MNKRPNAYEDRTYRQRVAARGLISFSVTVKETDLWVSAERDLKKETRDMVFDYRYQIETYIASHPEFATTLSPYANDPLAAPLIKEMIAATKDLNIGPMACVAGAIAQHVAFGLLKLTGQVIVENGGDVFMKLNRPATVSVFAGDSPLSEKFGIHIPEEKMPTGVCSSSGTVGHSLSLGVTDAACLTSHSALLADAAATALGNRVRRKRDLQEAAVWASQLEGITGGIIIAGDKMATWGDIELVEL